MGTRLHGRSAECLAIDELLATAADGRGAVLAFVGEPGIGKSALLEYGAHRAAAGGRASSGATSGSGGDGMATPQQHEELYWQVRERLLARHFAVGGRFRTNLQSIDNTLDPGPDSETLHRWNVAFRMRENPLMWSGRLLGAVAAEHQLGHPQAERILELGLKAIHTLYRFRRGTVFDGYPVRWDAVASDNWTETADTTVADDFLVDASQRYIYCLPHKDPRYVPKRVPSTLDRLLTPAQRAEYDANWQDHHEHHNVWELSMDELVGLAAVYSTAFELVPTATIRSRVVSQVTKLADYLAEHGYLLVRPAGGLNHRGATGILPALEFPLNRVFQRVTGTSFPARTDFVGAMDKAGYWRVLQLPVDRFAAGVVIGGLVAAPLLITLITVGGVAAPLVHHAVFGLAGGAPPGVAAAAPYVLAAVPRSLGLLNQNDVFEVSEQNEPAVAHLLSAIPATTRFHAFTDSLALLPASAGPNVRGFLPYMGLAALGDPDPTVAGEYLKLMADRRKETFDPVKTDGLDGCFASAVALLHGFDRAEEARLVELLDTRYATITAAGPELLEEADGREKVEWAMDYLIGVSLAWLYAKRRADAGDPVTTPGFPRRARSGRVSGSPARCSSGSRRSPPCSGSRRTPATSTCSPAR